MSDKAYEVDVAHSEIGFSVRHMVISNVRGLFNEFSGSFEFDPANPSSFSATAAVKVESIDTRNADRDTHLRSGDFFDTENHPEITFKSTRAEASGDDLVVHGDLTMRGVTKEITLTLSPHGPITDPWGLERAGFEGSATINRQDWGVSWSQLLDNGGLVVSDTVKITINVEGTRQAG